MSELRELARGGSEIAELLASVLSKTGYVDALEREGTIEAEGRIENLEQLVEVAREFDASAEPGEETLDAFLQQVALSTSADEAEADRDRGETGLVTLMTLHNAKGTEFPVVFIVGCEDGVIPHSRALEEGGLEEERRLFYVGVTRGMRELYLTYARRRALFGAGTYGLRSRFLDEIPAELIESDESTQPSTSSGGGYNGISAPGLLGRPPQRERWASSPVASEQAAARFRVGEDVLHDSFGEGVVTSVEPGGVVVVRFAGDGSERTLLAEYAKLAHA